MSKDVVAFCMQISINVKVRTEKSAKSNRGLFLLEAKKEQVKQKRNRLGGNGQIVKKGTGCKI